MCPTLVTRRSEYHIKSIFPQKKKKRFTNFLDGPNIDDNKERKIPPYVY